MDTVTIILIHTSKWVSIAAIWLLGLGMRPACQDSENAEAMMTTIEVRR
jgi:hypothetical protein